MGEEETDHIQTGLAIFVVVVTKYLTKLLKGGRICFGCWFQKVAVHLSAEGLVGAVPLRQKTTADIPPIEVDQKEKADWSQGRIELSFLVPYFFSRLSPNPKVFRTFKSTTGWGWSFQT